MTKPQIEELKRLAEEAKDIRQVHEALNKDLGFYGASQAYQELDNRLRYCTQFNFINSILSLISRYEKMREALEQLAVTEPLAREALGEM